MRKREREGRKEDILNNSTIPNHIPTPNPTPPRINHLFLLFLLLLPLSRLERLSRLRKLDRCRLLYWVMTDWG